MIKTPARGRTGTGKITSDQQAVGGLHHHRNQNKNSSTRKMRYGRCIGQKSFRYLYLCCSNTRRSVGRKNFFEGHANFMGIKSHQHGPLKLVHYYTSEGSERVRDDEFFEGNWPEKNSIATIIGSDIHYQQFPQHWQGSVGSEYLVAALISFGLGVACWLGYEWIGATVDEDGWLVEEFAMIPLTWFFLLLGLVAGGYHLWAKRRE